MTDPITYWRPVAVMLGLLLGILALLGALLGFALVNLDHQVQTLLAAVDRLAGTVT